MLAFEVVAPLLLLDRRGRLLLVAGGLVFHAGTRAVDGAFEVTGGRVLTVTAIGGSLDEAAARAYAACDRIRFDGMQLRRDIGWQARSRA